MDGRLIATSPEIELLWWEGCPSTAHARELLDAALAELGLPGAAIRMVEVRTDDEARALRFRGSPTILIDGVDLADLAAEPDARAAPLELAASALSCRAYRRRDGRISPTPDPEDVRAALLNAGSHPRAPGARL